MWKKIEKIVLRVLYSAVYHEAESYCYVSSGSNDADEIAEL